MVSAVQRAISECWQQDASRTLNGARGVLVCALICFPFHCDAGHGFAHLALSGKFSKLTPEAKSQHLLDELLPEMLDILWPEPKR